MGWAQLMDDTTPIITKPGIYHSLPFDQYLAIRAVNASTLKAMARHSPKHALACFEGRDIETTPSLMKGGATHAAILEPEKFASEYAIGPEERRNSNAWKSFEAANVGKLCMKPSEAAEVTGMRTAIWAHHFAPKLLVEMDWIETTIVWRDADTSLLCKARLDLYSTAHKILADVKTANDVSPKKFGAACHDLAYHLQLAWYARGLGELGKRVDQFGILGLESSEPFDVVVYQPPATWLNDGMMLADRALLNFASCLKDKHWPGYSGDQPFITLELPRWAA